MREPGSKIGKQNKPQEDSALQQDAVLENAIIEMKNGLPVVSREYYNRMRKIDIRVGGDETIATGDFRGYVREPDLDFYIDSFTTNGVLRDAEQPGVYVETTGIDSAGYSEHVDGSAEDIDHYLVCISVPIKLQERYGIAVNQRGECISAEEFLQGHNVDAPEDLARLRSKNFVMTIHLQPDQRKSQPLFPEPDAFARQKAEVIHQLVIDRLLNGVSPKDIQQEVLTIADKLYTTGLEDIENLISDATKAQLK